MLIKIGKVVLFLLPFVVVGTILSQFLRPKVRTIQNDLPWIPGNSVGVVLLEGPNPPSGTELSLDDFRQARFEATSIIVNKNTRDARAEVFYLGKVQGESKFSYYTKAYTTEPGLGLNVRWTELTGSTLTTRLGVDMFTTARSLFGAYFGSFVGTLVLAILALLFYNKTITSTGKTLKAWRSRRKATKTAS